MNVEEKDKFLKWALNYWYISDNGDHCVVKKGRTKRKFKYAKYVTAEEMQEDIRKYMSSELNYGWK